MKLLRKVLFKKKPSNSSKIIANIIENVIGDKNNHDINDEDSEYDDDKDYDENVASESEITEVYNIALARLPVPFPFIVVRNKKIVAASTFFHNKIISGELKTLKDIFPPFDPALPTQPAEIDGKPYTAYIQTVSPDMVSVDINSDINFNVEIGVVADSDIEINGDDSKAEELTLVYFIENQPQKKQRRQETEKKPLTNTKNATLSKTVVALIFIDNFDEVINSIDDAHRPLLLALIDRKLNTLAQQVSGILRKFEKDRYLFIFSYDNLLYLKEKRFDILNQIREINMGNTLPVTLSIGIGLGSTLQQSMEYARAAVDLALGRGGDQALVKDGENYFFFGGVAKEIGHNGRVRARVKAYAFSELIGEADKIVVMGHRNIDLDCLGSAVGVFKMASFLGKPCHIILNDVTSNVNFLYDRLMREKDYADGTFVSSADALELITEKTLIVIVDTHREAMVESPELLKQCFTSKVAVFDHHRMSADFIKNPVLVYHEPYASSTCELMTEMLQYMRGEIKLKQVEADALLSGITVDTKNFAIKTGAKTFEAAAYLRRQGADSIRVRLLFQHNLDSYKAKAAAVYNAAIHFDVIAVSESPSDVENPLIIAAQAADELLFISGIQASFVISEFKGKAFISARSLSGINVQVIMEKLGGGGHQTVAGAQLPGISISEAKSMLLKEVEEYITEVKR